MTSKYMYYAGRSKYYVILREEWSLSATSFKIDKHYIYLLKEHKRGFYNDCKILVHSLANFVVNKRTDI